MAVPFWLEVQPLLLASGSATRRDMLAAAGVPVEVARPEVDERLVDRDARRAGVPAGEIACLLAAAKAREVACRHPGRLVLGADQTLTCRGTIYDKPVDRPSAEAQLGSLAGQRHTLHAAAALVRDGTVLDVLVADAHLTMRPFSSGFLASYLDTVGDAATRSVGGYQVEGVGIQLFESIEGDHFTILGLPLLPLLGALRRLGALAP